MAVKLVLWLVTARISRRTSNPAVAALTLDHRNDILAAGAAACGIALGRAGLAWVDPAAAALVALVILRTGVEVLRESSNDLMGSQPGQQMGRQLQNWLTEVPGVRELQEVRAHSFGPYLVLNVTIGIDGTQSVAAGDAIADAVERVLHERLEFLRAVHVHYHPVGTAPVPAPRP